MLLDYSTYVSLFGKLEEARFNGLVQEAESYVNHYTFGRITDTSPSIQGAIKEITDYLASEEDKVSAAVANGRIVKSESSGTYRVEFDTARESHLIASTDAQRHKYIYEICLRWLAHTGLMYRGFRYDY